MKTQRGRLQRARANGYLDATCAEAAPVIRTYSFWCWRLRVPLIWYRRNSPRSTKGSVHLDLFTTANVLSDKGQSELSSLCDRLQIPAALQLSSFDAVWSSVPVARMDELAAMALRVATRFGHYALRPPTHSAELAKMIEAISQPVEWPKSA